MRSAITVAWGSAVDGGVYFICMCFCLSFSGCAEQQEIRPIQGRCSDLLIAKDHVEIELLEYRRDVNKLRTVMRIEPSDGTVMAATFHCETGQLLYGTWKGGGSSSKAELHIRDAVSEKKVSMDQGINLLIPLPTGELLIETAEIKRAPVDPMLGDLSREERGGDSAFRRSNPNVSAEAFHIYLEDVIWDPKAGKEVRRIRGTLGRRDIQDGKIVSYAMDQTVYEFDPKTGRRTRLHDINPIFSPGTPLWELPHPSYLFSFGSELYAVVGSGAENQPMLKFFNQNSVHKFDPTVRRWTSLVKMSFEPRWAMLDSGRIIAIGKSRMGIYEPSSGKFSEHDLNLNGNEPMSIARVGNNIALSVAKNASDPDRPATDIQIWILDGDMSKVLLKHPMDDFARTKLSSSFTPLPVVWN